MMRTKRTLAWIGLVMALLLAVSPVALAADGYEKALDSVVRIYSECTLSRYHDRTLISQLTAPAAGSGFAVGKKGQNPDTFVTNAHVVTWELSDFADIIINYYHDLPGKHVFEDGTSYNTQYTLEVTNYVLVDDLDTKKMALRTIVNDKYDMAYDVACVILSNPITERKPATIGLYDDLGRQDVWALGFPGLSDDVIRGTTEWTSLPSALNYCTVTEGKTQFMVNNDTFGSAVQHTADIKHGNSGGPLVDKNGVVVGVNTWGLSEDASQVNISQSTRMVKQFLDNENIAAEYVQLGSLPVATIAIIAAAAALIVAIVVFGVVSGRKKNPVAIVDPKGTRNLVVVSGALKKDNSYSLIPGKKFLIGTDSTRCNLAFPQGTPGVSRVHCSITFDGKTVIVKDENSSFGLYIDDQRLGNGKPTVLHRGHRLSLGSQKESLILR